MKIITEIFIPVYILKNQELSDSQKLILCFLKCFKDKFQPGKEYITASQTVISNMLSKPLQTVVDEIKKLEGAGWLKCGVEVSNGSIVHYIQFTEKFEMSFRTIDQIDGPVSN